MMDRGYDFYDSPIGPIYVVVAEKGVCTVELFEDRWKKYLELHSDLKMNKELCKEVIKQMDEYFKGERKVFDLSLQIEGTTFQRKVWDALRQIPYGSIKSYQDIANYIDNKKAIRAVGQANKANRLPIIIPCHRVIGKNGKLVGYAGDKTDVKAYLLNLEEINANNC